MKIVSLRVSPTLPPLEARLREEAFVRTVAVAPAWLSAFTAMRLARAVDREKADWIEVQRLDDAMSAISARKITKHPGAKIFVNLQPNSPTPFSVAAEIADEVDLWVFPSERMKEEYTRVCPTLRATVVNPPAHFGEIDMSKVGAPGSEDLCYLWLGNIEATERLRAAVDAISALPSEARLHVVGKGKPRYVTPVLRHLQALSRPDRIIFHGDQYSLTELLSQAHACVQADRDISPIETLMLQLGRPIIKPEEIATFSDNPPKAPDCETFSPKAHVERLAHALSQAVTAG